jgi:hypothetical protein
MEKLDERSFVHNGKTFAIKLFRIESGFQAIAFLDGKQVSPTYSVSFVTHVDYFMGHKQQLTDQLFSIAQSDIAQEMYFH